MQDTVERETVTDLRGMRSGSKVCLMYWEHKVFLVLNLRT